MIAETTATARIRTLDILRGLAVMGILAMNIVPFSLRGPAIFSPKVAGGDTGIDLAAWIVSILFFEGKMRALFAMLFGASFLLIIQRATAAGENPASVHYRRMIWLLAFGLVHFFFIWSGDILLLYAVSGMVLYLFRDQPVDVLVKWIVAFIILQIIATMISFSETFMTSFAAAVPGASAETIRHWHELQAAYGPYPADKLAKSLERAASSYQSHVVLRFGFWSWPIDLVKYSGAETLSNMLIGMAAFKSGFLTGEWTVERYRRWAFVCLAITLPIYAGLIAAEFIGNFDARIVESVRIAETPLRPIMAVGLAAIFILMTRHGGLLVDRIAAAGRVALTNYIGTSLMMTFIFEGFGFGMLGTLSRSQIYIPVLCAWGIMLLWSKPWLDHYRYGPLEWLWRSLARWELQPMRKRPRGSPLAAEA